MSEYIFKLPDLGEGTVEAEIVEWHVIPGDEVEEGDALVDVLTDKANVEVPAPVAGVVLRTSGTPGEMVAVGAELIALETGEQVQTGQAQALPGVTSPTPNPEPTPQPAVLTVRQPPPDDQPSASPTSPTSPTEGGRALASPALRRRAKEAGVDLDTLSGSGPRGRIVQADLEAALAGDAARPAPPAAVATRDPGEYEVLPVIGVRRVIAERMSQSKREIPHFAYVEEVDVTELERLRRHLNERHDRKLTVLAFVAMGLIRALGRFPQCNCRYDAEAGALQRYRSVHLGVATQTPDGLKVPVVRNAHALDLWQLAGAIAAVAEAARSGHSKPEQLGGSTITVTSLGALGGIVTTPIINHPEVSIIGLNKAAPRPVVEDNQMAVRTMMNLSSSFDHRFVDGFDAAAMIQDLKAQLEHPATLFIADPEG